MAGFAHCPLPIWRTDDFTKCFIRDYLKTLFPLTLIALSILQIAWFNIRRSIGDRKSAAYAQIGRDASAVAATEIPPSPIDSEFNESEDLEINTGGRLVLAKTTSRGSIVQADTPPGQRAWEIVEELAIAALVGTNAVALVTGTYGNGGHMPAIAGLISWMYALLLCSLRLFLGQSKWRVPHLWNHTAMIYAVNWFLLVVVLRSAIIHPSSTLTETIAIGEFALVTLLFGIALTTRKGNKTVLMEWENGLEPSREPLASMFSILTFSWVDRIIWQGWQQPLEIGDVWNLVPKDKAAHVLSDFRARETSSSLVWRIFRYFKWEITLQCLFGGIAGIFTFAPTLLVKKILEYVEHPDAAPRNVIWLLVIMLPVFDIVRSLAENMNLWIGRKVCIRVRAIAIGEIYAKSLRRKAATTKANAPETQEEATVANAASPSFFDKLKSMLGIKLAAPDDASATKDTAAPVSSDDDEADDEQANVGTIINLMSVDTYKIGELTAYLPGTVAAGPIQLIVSITLLWNVMGISAVPALFVMALLIPIQYTIAQAFNYAFDRVMAATDKRINITNEVLQNIRVIKYFAWEKRFGFMIDEKREKELKALRSRYGLLLISIGVYNAVPILITFFSFLIYTLVEKKPLVPSVAFTAISLFMLLRMPLDLFGEMFSHVQESLVSLRRVDDFLNEEETEKYDQLGTDNYDENGVKTIGFKDATLAWGSKDAVADDGTKAFRLLDLNLSFKLGKINIIAGATGSGKTSMLMGLLGEMTRISGRVYCPGGSSREDIRADPETGLADTIAYVAQSAWLINDSIRNNITFAAPFDEKRYWDVIRVCALERDLEILEHRDDTLVGEKGIALSGGQKQRISLARAVYSSSAHILMDDCLSAVDPHTAHWIYQQCIRGPLMTDRTCILVTHNTQLCVPSADYVVVLDNGRVAIEGSPAEVIESGKLGKDIQLAFKKDSVSANPSHVPSRVPSDVGQEDEEADGNDDIKNRLAKTTSKVQANPMDEGVATGAVKWPVMKLYLTSMGSRWYWIATVVVFLLQQLAPMATNFWVRAWANQYVAGAGNSVNINSSPPTWYTQMHPKAAWATIANLANIQRPTTGAMKIQAPGAATAFDSKDGVDDLYYITGLAIIGVFGALTVFMRDIWMFFGSLTASRRLHNRLMAAVMGAQFKFFDVTPLGQLMNRFSKDLEAVDQDIAFAASGFIGCIFGMFTTITLIAFITPGFLIPAFFISIAFYYLTIFYLGASRDLKRLESVQRTPVFQQFGETLAGITTIRAYGDQRRFIRDNLTKVNAANRPFIYMWSTNRWLAVRADFLGQTVTFFAGMFIILSLGKIDSGAAGISLSYAMTFMENVLWFIRLYGQNEQNMNSMERVKEYLEIDQEAAAVIEDNRPPATWPEGGRVEFENYTTRYRADLDPVLRNVSVMIQPKEKVGIVGRTGAGKSSLTLALFRALEAVSGKIVIDGIDISKIGLQDLREKITIVPQDPTLFIGTIRSNLDPFDQFSDAEVFEALRRVHLIAKEEMNPAIPIAESSSSDEQVATNKNIFLDLSFAVTESGGNLSQGQRQLLCLARAMLKMPKVLVMDEATASIDYNTDAKIQETIREMTGTVITIAHRLQTIVDYDKVLVLDKGELVEFAHPWELIQDEKSQFHGMCASSGNMDILMTAAKKKWDESH
ncbi:hypothetical protein VHEMI09979 [[Torrubiella] hemipterigena]|uniref:ATP-dependent bile acid permease n=1 Tax=[Torrubiella] hemipterigena TaxID=1531966 RepID=A0A0A1THM2_9HYPO|nr:hypothetical protein VHEMI09979 [[Torrubiella] hemipterigena]